METAPPPGRIRAPSGHAAGPDPLELRGPGPTKAGRPGGTGGGEFGYSVDIRDNQIGLFVVTRSDDAAQIVHNNITANRQYNVKLGWQQPGPVTLPENWWGTTDPAAITESFFDQRIERNLGRDSAPEPLTGPVDIDDWQNFQGVAP